jgi:hypothetical protein
MRRRGEERDNDVLIDGYMRWMDRWMDEVDGWVGGWVDG